MRTASAAIFGWILALSLIGCQKQYIPNTEIVDTDFNREVIAFVERYRHAVEDRNIGVLMSLAAPRYFDNSGTPTGDDDVDRDGLERVISERFSAVEEIRFEMRYRDIFVQDSVVFVQYTYTMSFQYSVDGETRWHNHTGDKRLELERQKDSFLILSGM